MAAATASTTTASTQEKIPKWRISGDWFDVCKCNIPCPCEFAQTPTYEECDGILAYNIKKGNYGQTALDGLNILGSKCSTEGGSEHDFQWKSRWFYG
jgi:hypothetical protein